MTAWTLEAPMPAIDLPGGMVLAFEAIDPTTGAAVTGCSVSDVAIYSDDLGGGVITIEDVIPSWTPLEVEGAEN